MKIVESIKYQALKGAFNASLANVYATANAGRAARMIGDEAASDLLFAMSDLWLAVANGQRHKLSAMLMADLPPAPGETVTVKVSGGCFEGKEGMK